VITVRPIRDNALSLLFGALFLVALCGQSVAGYLENNERLTEHAKPAIDFVSFVT
jgi:hypothetical protein